MRRGSRDTSKVLSILPKRNSRTYLKGDWSHARNFDIVIILWKNALTIHNRLRLFAVNRGIRRGLNRAGL